MLKKLNLKNADEYDYHVATLYAVDAVIRYLDGEEICHRIGNEQGDIDEWDDVVLHGAGGIATHCQIKRQMTDFCNLGLTRSTKRITKQTKSPGELQDLSPLDSAFEKLATYFANPSATRGAEKLFRLAIPYPSIKIKNDLTVVQLIAVCSEWRKAGATLAGFSSANGPTANVREWLSSWCNFGDDAAMFACLRALEIKCHGDEDRLNSDCRNILVAWYACLPAVELKIRDFIKANASSAQSITPRMIACHVDTYIRPERRAWARYFMGDSSNWEISGTLSGNGSDIELPKEVVDRLWQPAPNRNYELQFAHECDAASSGSLNATLMRLALHVAQGVGVVAAQVAGWQAIVAQTVRMTLGGSNTECSELRWTNWAVAPSPSDHRKIETNRDVEDESSQLTEQMNFVTWHLVKKKVNTIISASIPGEVRDAVEHLWHTWRKEIDGDRSLQLTLMADMLHAKVEGESNLGMLRAGPRTVHLLADALVMLLHLAVGHDHATPTWNAFGSSVSVRTVALQWWAGPHQLPGQVRRFFDFDPGGDREMFLGKETARLLVLPQAAMPESVVRNKSLAEGKSDGDRMGDARMPRTVVTRSIAFQQAIEKNTLASLKRYVNKVLQSRQAQRTEHSKVLTTGQIHGS